LFLEGEISDISSKAMSPLSGVKPDSELNLNAPKYPSTNDPAN